MLTTMAQSPASYLIHIPIPSATFSSKSTNHLVHWSIFLQKLHITHPIEKECCFCQFWLNSQIGMSKCAINGRKFWHKNIQLSFVNGLQHVLMKPMEEY